MNPSRPFILRPVATTLMMIAIMLSGMLAFRFLPVAALPPVILTGGEGKWTSGDDGLDRSLADRARFSGYRPIAIANTHFTLWTAR